MPTPGFWARVREARLARVLLVYLAGAWLVLQATALLRQELQLPTWVTPVAILLLLIGLFVIVATAWVQSHPLGAARAAREEIPSSWEIDLGDVKESVARGRMPHLTWGRSVLAGVAAFLVLTLVAGGVVLLRGRGETLAPSEARAEAAAPGLAVLPFSVSGPGLEQWREGMVDLVSTNLDGVAGLRTIDSRTVMAGWDRAVPAGSNAGLDSALEVARNIGARYALTGSAVASGRGMRLVADVYDVRSGRELGQAQVEGSPDSIFGLVDQLSIEVVRAIVGKEGEPLPRVDLAHVTTASLPALKAFLEGEVLFRRSDFEGAIPLYQRAVESDSSFALALYRLSFSYAWADNIASEVAHDYVRQAVRNSARLPERDALLVRGLLALQIGNLDGLEPLRSAVKKYPDDAEAWFLLGDTYHHLGDDALVSMGEDRQAFRRAIALDPAFTPAYIHLLEGAVSERGDSAEARRLGSLYDRLAPGSEFGVRNRLALDLAFGGPSERERAEAALDTLPIRTMRGLVPYLFHPRFLPLRQLVSERIFRRPDNPRPIAAAEGLFWARVDAGQIRAAQALLEDPVVQGQALVPNALHTLVYEGLDVPRQKLEQVVQEVAGDTLPERGAWYGALIATDLGRARDHAAIVANFRARAGRLEATDTTAARHVRAAVEILEGYEIWKTGDAEKALAVFQRYQGTGVPFDGDLRWWIGDILLHMGRQAESRPYFESFRLNPWAQRKLAPIYEELGDYARARRAWELVAIGWRDADPELQPRVEEARAAARRLTSVVRE